MSRFTPVDILFFPKWKCSLKGGQFKMVQEKEEKSIKDLLAVTQYMFQDAFQKCKKLWRRCSKSGGEYFEVDKTD